MTKAKTLQELREQLIAEQVAITIKIGSLSLAIEDGEFCAAIGREHYGLLMIQLQAMRTYAEVLFQRIRLLDEQASLQKGQNK